MKNWNELNRWKINNSTVQNDITAANKSTNEVVLTALSIPVKKMWKQKPKKLD